MTKLSGQFTVARALKICTLVVPGCDRIGHG